MLGRVCGVGGVEEEKEVALGCFGEFAPALWRSLARSRY